MAYSHGSNILIVDLGANFEPQGASPGGGEEYTNYVSKNRAGNFIPATNQQRNKISRAVQNYKAILPAGATVNIVLGGDGSDYALWIATRVTLRQINTGDAALSIDFHKNDGNGGLHAPQKFTVALPSSGYGVTANPLTGALVDNCVSMDWIAEIGHKDVPGRLGDHLYGFSNGCRISCRQNYVDDEAAIALASGWFLDSDVPSDANEDVRTRALGGHTFQDPDA